MSCAVCRRLSTADVVRFFCCRSHRRFRRRDSESSVASIFLRVVRGDTMGIDPTSACPSRHSRSRGLSSGSSLFGLEAYCIFGVDREAIPARFFAIVGAGGSRRRVERREDLESRLGRDADLGKGVVALGRSSSDTESVSQSSSSLSDSSCGMASFAGAVVPILTVWSWSSSE